ncbi:MAG TPA: AI-2E family transporter [Gammaproteobacteria bacterium]|nr:AI-2E family transporter [Gammaproteobacteria bacterium]
MSSDISRPTSISLVILATVAVFYVLVVGKSVLVPLAVAIMIWYVINALSRSYAKLLPWVADRNWVTTLMSLFSIGLFVAFSVDMIQNNISDVSAAAPEYKRNFDALSIKVIQQFNLQDLPNINQVVKGIEIAPLITTLAGTFTNMISDIFIVLIYVLFLMLEQGTFQNKISAMFPNNEQRGSILSILSHAQEDIQTYLWIKTITSLITGTVSYFILLAVGVDFAGFWAFTIFLLNFIPTIGSIIATLFPALLTLIQFDTFGPFLIVLLGVGSVQIAVGNFLEPKLMGNSLNVSPLVVMLSLTLWGSVWGVAGMFLSVPITVMMLIVFAHFKETRHWAILLSGNGSLKFAEQVHSIKSD